MTNDKQKPSRTKDAPRAPQVRGLKEKNEMSGTPFNFEQIKQEGERQDFWLRHTELHGLSEDDRQALDNSMIAWLKTNKRNIEANYWRTLPKNAAGPLGPWALVAPFESAYKAISAGIVQGQRERQS